jgi:hypothetical protein
MELSNSLEVLGERLFERYGIDLVYVNSPLVSRQTNTNQKNELPNRVWWEEKEATTNAENQDINDETGNTPSTNKQLVGLDASLLLLKQVWNSMPFWGILAIGKGAALGSLLPLMALNPEPSFCCFVHGDSLLEDEEERLIDNLPCLHIVGKSNEMTNTNIESYSFSALIFVSMSLSIAWQTYQVKFQDPLND